MNFGLSFSVSSSSLQPSSASKTDSRKDVSREPRDPGRTHAKIWWTVLPALVLPLVASLFYFVLFPGTVFGNSFYGGIKVLLLVWPVVVSLFVLKRPLLRDALGRKRPRASLIQGALFGIAVVAVMFGLLQTPLGDFVTGSSDRIRQRVSDIGMLEHFVLWAFVISLVHSFMEEFYWRWFVFGHLREVISLPKAHALAAVAFASHHIVITSQFFNLGFGIFLGVCVGIGGAMWSWLYQRHHTLWGAWLSHAIIDFGIFWVGYRVLFGGEA